MRTKLIIAAFALAAATLSAEPQRPAQIIVSTIPATIATLDGQVTVSVFVQSAPAKTEAFIELNLRAAGSEPLRMTSGVALDIADQLALAIEKANAGKDSETAFPDYTIASTARAGIPAVAVRANTRRCTVILSTDNAETFVRILRRAASNADWLESSTQSMMALPPAEK